MPYKLIWLFLLLIPALVKRLNNYQRNKPIRTKGVSPSKTPLQPVNLFRLLVQSFIILIELVIGFVGIIVTVELLLLGPRWLRIFSGVLTLLLEAILVWQWRFWSRLFQILGS